MFAQATQSQTSLKEMMKLATYQTLYNSVRNRLCAQEEALDYDFFTAFHPQHFEYLQRYFLTPTMYHCKGSVGFQGMFNAGNSYLVVARFGKVILLLEPEAACLRNLPFIATLEADGFFHPHLGCAVTFWQTYIEPCQMPSGGNVLG